MNKKEKQNLEFMALSALSSWDFYGFGTIAQTWSMIESIANIESKNSLFAKIIGFIDSFDKEWMICMDCGKYQKDHCYMLKKEIWKQIHYHKYGLLCIECAEKRLGRELNHDDFTDAPVNKSSALSDKEIGLRFNRSVKE